MCGRFGQFLPRDALAHMFRARDDLTDDWSPSWNIAPSQTPVVVVRDPENDARRMEPLRWGLIPSWVKDPAHARRPINARAETVATSGMFRNAYTKRRCLVPADVFYEWRAGPSRKQPYAIARNDGTPMALAALWDVFHGPDGQQEIRTFAIVTTSANAEMRPIHHRMPVIVDPKDWPVWLGEQEGNSAALLTPPPDGLLRAWPVSRQVNRRQNDGPELLAAIDVPEEPGDGHAERGPEQGVLRSL